MAKFVQPSLASGEISPGLRGRVDLQRYATALATCSRFITKPTGGAIKCPGFRFNGEVKDSAHPPRILPFIYSTEIKYLLEVGIGYIRFWIPATPYGYTLLRDGGGVVVEVATTYAAEHLPLLRVTQSADVFYFAGINGTVRIPPRELRRTSSTSFTLQDFPFRRGPFRSMNTDESVKMAVSVATGVGNLTCSASFFNANHVGAYFYFEEKELRNVKPWTPLEKNVAVGTKRRSDGKIYRCTSVPNTGGGAGTPYYICGNDRPLHEIGRAFDGPQDKRSDGVNDYWVGVEWEYEAGSFGIVKATAYTSPTLMSCEVVERIADSIVGTAAAPSSTWTKNGTGVAVTFNLTVPNNVSSSVYDYRVTINGVAVPPNPYQEPTSGGGGTGGGPMTGRPRTGQQAF